MKIPISIMLLLSSSVVCSQDFSDSSIRMRTLEHTHYGCPINSICSKAMGTKILKWEKLLKSTNTKNQLKKIRTFQKRYGLPFQFLTTHDHYQESNMAMWNSRCTHHNPKNKHNTIYKGMSFLKKIDNSKANRFNKVILYRKKKNLTFNIPYGDHPIFIKNNSLVFIKDYDDYYYQIAVRTSGAYSVVDHPYSIVQKALGENIKSVKCNSEIEYDQAYFKKSYCQKLFNIDTGKLETIQMTWTCP